MVRLLRFAYSAREPSSSLGVMNSMLDTALQFDCVIVGARCAGAALAIHLMRAGMRVIVLEADALHTDQPFSTHVIQTPGMDLLDELGVGERVRALTPPIRSARFEVCGHPYDLTLAPERSMYCPRRSTFDPLLQDAALAAGVEIRDKTRVTDLLRDGDVVCGVTAEHAGTSQTYRARWVVGADGRNSSVARLAGAKSYIEHEAERGGYWGYWRKPSCWDHADPWRRFQSVISIDDTVRFVFECDADLLIMGAIPSREVARGWGKQYPQELRRALLASELTAALVQDEPVAPLVGLLKTHFFFREPVGSGWALVGDAGLHKDPTPGHGITDALRDAAALARALVDGRPEALEVYWRRRDVLSVPLYYQALSMGRLAYANPFNALVMERLNHAGPEQLARMREVVERKRSPFDGVARGQMLRWVGAEMLRGQWDVFGHFVAAARFTAIVEREQAQRDRLLALAEARL
jgi:flavin-dependent dehydrogenase